MELGHGLLGITKKGEDVDISQVAMFSIFRGLASLPFGYVLLKTPFLPPFFLS